MPIGACSTGYPERVIGADLQRHRGSGRGRRSATAARALLALCRYITRPAITNQHLTLNRAGQVVLTLKTPYREGTTHLVMSSLDRLGCVAVTPTIARLPPGLEKTYAWI